MNTNTLKPVLRQQLLAARRAMPAHTKLAADQKIVQALSDCLTQHPPKILGAYLAMPGEPDLSELYTRLAARGLALAMPVVTEKNQPLRFISWQAGDPLARDASGTLAPIARTGFVKPDVVLAPCLGFTAGLLRLGYGGGYFDRTLAESPRPRAIGIAYAFAEVDFTADKYDVALDQIITEAFTRDSSAAKSLGLGPTG